MQKEQELSPEQEKAIQTIEKLLRLAARNTNENERNQAAAKAQELMTLWNLDQASVDEDRGDVKRADERFKGGHFQYQRDLWSDVAKLNFCLYFTVTEFEKTCKRVLKDPTRPERGTHKVWSERRVSQHRIVGRTVNTRATRVMAEYLEGAIERLTAEALVERFGPDATTKAHGKWAASFREGAAERVCEKIFDRRQELMAAERKAAEKAARAATKVKMANVSTSTAVTIASFSQSERDANDEFLNPGILERRAKWKAHEAAEQVKRAAADAAAQAAYTRWAEANPIEARLEAEKAKKRREEERKREERNSRRRTGYSYREPAYKGDWSARKAGYQKGESISINQQAGSSKKAGLLG